MIILSFWHIFQLLLVYFESLDSDKNNMFSVSTNKCTSTEGQPMGPPGIKEQDFFVALFTGLLFRRNKALFDPPFYFH